MRIASALLLVALLPGLLLPAGTMLCVCTCAWAAEEWYEALTLETSVQPCDCGMNTRDPAPVAGTGDDCGCCLHFALPSSDGLPKIRTIAPSTGPESADAGPAPASPLAQLPEAPCDAVGCAPSPPGLRRPGAPLPLRI